VIIIADTSGLIAASDKNAAEAADCRTVLADSGAVIISPLVLTEVDHLAKSRFGSTARTAIIDSILFQVRRGRFEIPAISTDSLETARQVQRRYSALDLDLADGVNVALAAEYRTEVVLTLDRRDFRAIRPLTPHASFRLLPDDLSGA
jgi:predicted nucleic acid-binding protein